MIIGSSNASPLIAAQVNNPVTNTDNPVMAVDYEKLALRLIAGKTCLEIFESNYLQIPDIYEQLEKVILSQYPKDSEILEEVAKNMKYMTFEQAKDLMANHSDKKHLKLIQVADQMMALSLTYSNEKEAAADLNQGRELLMKTLELTQKMEEIEAKKAKQVVLSEAELKYIQNDFDFGSIFFMAVQANIYEMNFEFKELSMERHMNLVRNADKHPLLAKHLEHSKEKMANYIEKMEKAFVRSGVEKIKPEFKTVLFGPKAMILDHYGFRLSDPDGTEFQLYPFINVSRGTGYRYSLENATLADFEKEIRDDLTNSLRSGAEIKPACLENETAPIPLDEAEMKEQAVFNKAARDWGTMSKDEQLAFITHMLQYSKWDKLGIKPEQMHLGASEGDRFAGSLIVDQFNLNVHFDIKKMRMYLARCAGDSVSSYYELKEFMEKMPEVLKKLEEDEAEAVKKGESNFIVLVGDIGPREESPSP